MPTRVRAPLIGAVCGLLLWSVIALAVRHLPAGPLFYVAAFVFAFGPGAVALTPLIDGMSTAERITWACAFGLVLAPTIICVLALVDGGALFPPLAFALAGTAAASWRNRTASPAPRAEAWCYALIPAAVFACALWVSSGRLAMTADRAALFGDYDTLDLTYYAAIGAEINHTTRFPPISPFYSGHRIIYSYYPLAFLAAIPRFTGISMLRTFLELGWPFFGGVAAAAVFAFCRRIGSVPFAATTTVLTFSGAGLAYLAAWFSPEMVSLDPLIWSSMFLAPSAEWLFFNPWTPSLAVTSLGLYALVRMRDSPTSAWIWIAATCFGSLFMFKSFAFAVTIPALALSTAVWLWRRDPAWPRLAMVTVGAVLTAAPWLLAILPFNRQENRGAVVAFERLWMVRRMLLKTNLTDPLAAFIERHIGHDSGNWMLLTAASLLFLAGGLGLRWLGALNVVRAAVGRPSWRSLTPVAWIVILGIAIPFFVTIAPFPNSIQPHMFAMFMFWPFAAQVIWPAAARVSGTRLAATAAIIALSVPATAHYAAVTHAASNGKPLDTLGPTDVRILDTLRTLSPTSTMLLQSNPVWPSLYTIEAGRHVALGWSTYVSGDNSPDVDALTARIAAFFGSPSNPGSTDLALLKEQRVTHIIERTATDRLHPEVVALLQLLVGDDGVRLYRVPPTVRR